MVAHKDFSRREDGEACEEQGREMHCVGNDRARSYVVTTRMMSSDQSLVNGPEAYLYTSASLFSGPNISSNRGGAVVMGIRWLERITVKASDRYKTSHRRIVVACNPVLQ